MGWHPGCAKQKFRKGNIPHNTELNGNSTILLYPVTKFKRLSRDEFDLATKAVDNSGSLDIPVPTMSVWFLHQILQSGLVVKWAENEEKSG